MKPLFLAYNDSLEITNAQMFETDKTIPFVQHNFIKPKVNLETMELYESATPEEISDFQNQQKKTQLENFIVQKKKDGEQYYNEIELSLTMVLAGLPLQELVPVNTEIEEKIKPIINEVKIGDWFNAYMKLHVTETYIRPTHLFLAQTFDNIKESVKNYFETNYPR